MKILHLEDNREKASDIQYYLDADVIIHASCFKAYQQVIVKNQDWDLIILDMFVPLWPSTSASQASSSAEGGQR